MKKKRHMKRIAVTLMVLLIFSVCLFVLKYPEMKRNILNESRNQIRDLVIEKAIECYSIEGAYPKDIEYLEEHYGLVINHREYIVSYDYFASNMMPTVRVLVRGEE
ncbi:MAG: hypothetical protein MJ171_05825 [Clostridia bacterium]|nr:hypothetical protein [Clostridia bacterium]